MSELRSWKKNGLPANPRTQATSPIHSYGEVEMTYYAIGTDPEEAEGGVPRSAQPSVFPLLRSLDLVEGRAAGHAMVMVDQAIPSNLITECDAGNRLLPNTKQ